jgi:hypothetical protein
MVAVIFAVVVFLVVIVVAVIGVSLRLVPTLGLLCLR